MADGATDLHRAVLQVLLEKIEEDPYPSVTMMDMAEQMLRAEDRAPYAEILIDKIRAERFPSIDMLRRITALGG
ncbi:hypothetical protein [Nocardioides bizhenqiangii]|uniref:DUF2795 domain-containing protein n=1 Tax=Nocardioides bizhenqiangii TaxID=3095076 RepID=A0ABZ0ZQM3_9ACTN|nr:MULTISPECIES: hypothetical protein [unclassified Nocardioides]MDZ5619844.1 hypothetical protein [Nocardioides sp. HM23]WQQ26149.1 hypothetical protein SHK19_19575 [Nocardioides sp. HM61]